MDPNERHRIKFLTIVCLMYSFCGRDTIPSLPSAGGKSGPGTGSKSTEREINRDLHLKISIRVR